MTYKVITYEQRVRKMQKPGDEEIQLRRAKNYVRRLRNRMRNADSLEEKLLLSKAVKEAESVLRRLRQNIFDLEDMLNERVSRKALAVPA